MPQLLVVGNLFDWSNAGQELPKGDGISFLDFSDFDGPALQAISPDIVVSGLFGTTFDALDIATILQALRYRGRYRVVADKIPKPSLVRSEVRLVAPDIDFDILNLQAEMAEFF